MATFFYKGVKNMDFVQSLQSLIMLGAVAVILAILISIALYVITAIALAKLAKKAGLGKDAWMAWIPVLQNLLFLRMIDKEGWYLLVFFIPTIISILPSGGFFALISFVGYLAFIVLTIMFFVDFFKRFDQSPWAVLSLIIPFVFVGYIVYMGFSKDVQYVSTNRYQTSYGGGNGNYGGGANYPNYPYDNGYN